jgi:hypothetical protein
LGTKQTSLIAAPQNEPQHSLKARALQISADLAQTRLLLFVETDSQIPTPFLIVIVSWFVILFATFALFSDLNATALTFLCIFALSAPCVIYLILELNESFNVLLMIPETPLRNALAPL